MKPLNGTIYHPKFDSDRGISKEVSSLEFTGPTPAFGASPAYGLEKPTACNVGFTSAEAYLMNESAHIIKCKIIHMM